MIFELTNPLNNDSNYSKAKETLQKGKGPVHIYGVSASQSVHMLSELGDTFEFILIVTNTVKRAKAMQADFKNFVAKTFYVPAKDLIFYQADLQGKIQLQQRMRAYHAILEQTNEPNTAPCIVITTIDALMNPMAPIHSLEKGKILLEEGASVSSEQLQKQLTQLGYQRVNQITDVGQFSVRGGIIDIFSLIEEAPYRIELWGDEIDTIRSFDVESQRSIERIERVEIFSATELIVPEERITEGIEKIEQEYQAHYQLLRDEMLTEEAARLKRSINEFIDNAKWGIAGTKMESFMNYFVDETVSLLDYFPLERTLIVVEESLNLESKALVVEKEFQESMMHRLEKGYLLPRQVDMLFSAETVLVRLLTSQTVLLSNFDQLIEPYYDKKRESLFIKSTPIQSYKMDFKLLIHDLQDYHKKQYKVVLLCASRTRAERLAKELLDYDLHSYYKEEAKGDVMPGEIMVTQGSLTNGFIYPDLKYVMMTDDDMFGDKKSKKKAHKKHNKKGYVNDVSELSFGDYVIHEKHGLGIYQGIVKQEVNHIIKDYIQIVYADNGKLFIPISQVNYVQKYADSDAKKPKLNRIGSPEWTKTKERVKKEIGKLAQELVDLYALRQQDNGFAFSPDTVWQREFEELFPYDETQDQLVAIKEAKQDMESAKIMDRLICGDVGYGKTEIAIRLAFKAVQDNKQVAYLVPTTILAQQHYNTFVQRMKDFPIQIEMLSRFRTTTQINHTIRELKKGMVDIVVGTHRVLSKDVEFKDLGLLIVDEEQRFGVAQKEQIKHLKKSVDVLTLTATPIPRTLHMGLTGIRGMSSLQEAPSERVPIQTFVMEYNEAVVHEAINREMNRDGQVYYVYNRVNDIADVAGKVQKLNPDAVVAYAHGKMPKRQLEKIMLDFINHEIDVLVSTTIIETGLDISNVNTIIIHDADRYGLSQLYQLRGRVGRSNRVAYAFILYKKDKMLTEEAQKRLEAIRDFTELGSGIRIALKDLEIRGAGNLLGEDQSGHMEAIGYDLYCKMLNEALETLKGEKSEIEEFETVIDMNIDAYIPATYIKSEIIKLQVYKKIATITNEEEFHDLQDELVDRFSDMPKVVEQLLEVALLKAMAHELWVTEIKKTDDKIRITMHPKAPVDVSKIPEILKKNQNCLKFNAVNQPYFLYKAPQKMANVPKNVTNDAKNALKIIKLLLL